MKRLALFLIMLTSSLAAEEHECAIAPDHPLIGPADWYGLYLNDKKVGHAEERFTHEVVDDEPVIDMFLYMEMQTGDAVVTFEMLRRFESAPPHRLIGGYHQQEDLGVTFLQRADGLLILDQEDNSHTLSDVDHTLCDEGGLSVFRFLESDPEVGSGFEVMDFDVIQQIEMPITYRLEEASERIIRGVRHRFHVVAATYEMGGQSMTENTTFQRGEVINTFIGGFELRRESEETARAPNQAIDLLAEFEKPLDRPLTDLAKIDALTLKVTVGEAQGTIDDVLREAFLQRVEPIDDRSAIVTIADHPAPKDDKPPAFYLRSTPSHPADHPRVRALLEEALAPVAKREDEHAVATTLVRFVSELIEDAPNELYGHNSLSVLNILDQRIGDCTEHSQLFVTLARAAGLPAREVNGYVYNSDHGRPALAGHMWAEVMIDGGWIGVDPTWDEVVLNRSHVQTRTAVDPSLAFEVVDIVYR